MILLDTNFASEPTKISPDPKVLAWFNRQNRRDLFLSSVCLAEMLDGIERLPAGRRKETLRRIVTSMVSQFETPLLAFDGPAAYRYAELVTQARLRKYTLPVADAQIAAIAAVHGFSVATRDVAPFLAAGVPVINPWEEA